MSGWVGRRYRQGGLRHRLGGEYNWLGGLLGGQLLLRGGQGCQVPRVIVNGLDH